MLNKINMFKRQQGVSLLELMLSLAIIAVILTMATRFYQQANETRKTNEAYQAVVGLVAAVDNWKAANPTAKAADLTPANLGGFYPASYFLAEHFVFDGATLALNGGKATITGLPGTINCGLDSRIKPVLSPGTSSDCSGTGTLAITFVKV
jgi:prepilin-type N-terminal cleavage/methylation domain-containing protein